MEISGIPWAGHDWRFKYVFSDSAYPLTANNCWVDVTNIHVNSCGCTDGILNFILVDGDHASELDGMTVTIYNGDGNVNRTFTASASYQSTFNVTRIECSFTDITSYTNVGDITAFSSTGAYLDPYSTTSLSDAMLKARKYFDSVNPSGTKYILGTVNSSSAYAVYEIVFDLDQVLRGVKMCCGRAGTAQTYYQFLIALDGDQRDKTVRCYYNRPNSPFFNVESIYYTPQYDISTITLSATVNPPLLKNDIYTIMTAQDLQTIIDTIGPPARAYFDSLPSGGGQGTCTLSLKPPAQLLTFTSALYGKSISKWIASGSTTIEFNGPAPAPSVEWEMLMYYAFNGGTAAFIVDSLFNGHMITPWGSDKITGEYLEFDRSSGSGNGTVNIVKACVARTFDTGTLSLPQYDAKAVGDTMRNMVDVGGLCGIVVAKKNANITIPYEVGYKWKVGSSMTCSVMKINESDYVPWQNPSIGDYIKLDTWMIYNVGTWNGTIDLYEFTCSQAGSDSWKSYRPDVAFQYSLETAMVFAKPSAS